MYAFISDEMLDDKPYIIEFLSTTKIFMDNYKHEVSGITSVYKQTNKGDLICKWHVRYKDNVDIFQVQWWQVTTTSTI